jgi:hypothetical protein
MPDKSDLSEKLLTTLPMPLSKMAYSLARRTIRKDPRETLFASAFERLRTVGTTGDYVEFGVYRGASFMTNWRLAQRYGFRDMRFFAFDSFTGLPEEEGPIWKFGMYSCSKERFMNVIRKAGADLNRVTAVEGIFSETLTPRTKLKYGLRKAAFVHVDCDLYTSTKQVLGFITDLIGHGTVLAFDDWQCFEGNEQAGEPKAFGEWPPNAQFEELYSSGQQRAFICVDPAAETERNPDILPFPSRAASQEEKRRAA